MPQIVCRQYLCYQSLGRWWSVRHLRFERLHLDRVRILYKLRDLQGAVRALSKVEEQKDLLGSGAGFGGEGGVCLSGWH